MMADPAVASIEEQSAQINYTASEGAKRRYTPDTLVMFRPNTATELAAAPLLYEIKYRDEYKAKFLEMKAGADSYSIRATDNFSGTAT